MTQRTKRLTLLAVAGFLLGGCGTQGSSAGTAASTLPSATPVTLTDAPITLRLAVPDAMGRPSEASVNRFAASVASASHGNITIAPTFEAGAGTAKGFEVGVADLLKRGDYDLAIVASRTWGLAGVTSLEGFQAPYLIDNDALVVAVARSDVAQDALGAMGNGVLGLTIWPEDLRHLVTFPGCDVDFRSPTGVAGHTVLFQPSSVSRELIVGSLGAAEYIEDDRALDAQACRLQGQENGLSQVNAMALPTAVVIGNVTLYPKFQVLAANQDSFDHLSSAQRQILMTAAAEAQAEGIARRSTDAALSLAWCARGGSVVLSGEDQRQAYIATGETVYARLEADPVTKGLIDAIRALKATIQADPGTAAQACSGITTFVPAPTSATSDGIGFSSTVPPDGTYRAEFRVDDLMAKGATAEWATGNAGIWTWTFGGGRYSYTDINDLTCIGSAGSVDDHYHLELDGGQSANCIGGDFRWKEEADGIRLMTFIDQAHTSAQDYWDVYRWLDIVWVKIE
jgi:TRAP-type C4-dicarboxylate transport system substrate-binding protein